VLRRINVLLIVVLCIATLICFMALAQDKAKLETKDGDLMITDEKVDAPKDGSAQKIQVFMNSKDGKTIIMDANDSNAGSGKRANKRSGIQGTSEGNRQQFQMSPDMMKKDGLSPEKMKEIEADKKMREKQNMGKESAGTPAPPGTPQPQQNQSQGPGTPDSGLQRYLSVIMNKNLFMPLGSGRKEQKPSYVLTGVISDDSGKADNKAIIEQAGGQRSYFVSPGESVDDAKVTEIDEWQVKMDRSGEQMTLKLGEGTHSEVPQGFRGDREGSRGSAPGGGRKGGSDKPAGMSGGGDNFNPDDIPPFVKQMLQQQGISIEDLKNNPDLREKLKQQFQQKFGGGGEGGGQGRRGGQNN